MFEQPLYYNEPAAKAADRGDLFRDYEIKNWEITPRIYKILAVAAIANLLGLIIVGQTSLLTTKGCDSPLVGRVCEVLDTVYVATTMFGTDREYIDAAYEHTDLGDSEITFVDVTGMETEPLEYPTGYFQIANPEQFLATNETPFDDEFTTSGIPGIPSGIPITPSPGSSLLDTSPNIPPANPNPIQGTLPEFGGAPGGPNPTIGRNRRGGGRVPRPTGNPTAPTPTPDAETVAKAEPTPAPTVEPTEPVTDVELNKRPFVDLATVINDLQDKKQVDLATPFLITATGKLNKDGKLDPKSFSYGQKVSPNPKMIEVVMEAIEAMNASGYLQYLSMVDVKNLSFVIQQDDNNVTALVESQFENDLRPKTVSTLLTAYINKKKEAKAVADASPNDKDDLLLLSNATVVPQGKKVKIQFTIPKANIQQMIQRKLVEARATPTPQNGNAVSKTDDNTAINKP